MKIEEKVKLCYKEAPFPDNLRRAKKFNKELKRTIDWIKLNLDFLSANISGTSPSNILCAGCGTGEEAISLAKIFPKSKIDAIDISSESLKIASQNIRRAKVKNITLAMCSIVEDLPHEKKKYDFIYSAGVIHHLSNPRIGFKVLTRKLKEKGKMVIMLYNSYGLFFYKCQLALLSLLSFGSIKARMFWVQFLGFDKGKGKVEIYDSYLNPQIKTFTIDDINSWAKEEKMRIEGIVPPLNLQRIVVYALSGKKYFFRRKKILALALNITRLITAHMPLQKTNSKSPNLNPVTNFFFQLMFLILGKGECQYLLENKN